MSIKIHNYTVGSGLYIVGHDVCVDYFENTMRASDLLRILYEFVLGHVSIFVFFFYYCIIQIVYLGREIQMLVMNFEKYIDE